MKKPERIKTLSIQRRIYPDIVEAIEDQAAQEQITPTKLAARHLRNSIKKTRKQETK